MKIKDQTFTEEDIHLDGNEFEGCKFIRCRMHFRAAGPVGLVNCHLDDVTWHFEDAASTTMAFVSKIVELGGDYGNLLLINTFPSLRGWINQEILNRFNDKGKTNG